MQELDKRAMGVRIRQIRTRAGLRQWELAKILGTTQSAVHKYEHGVVPEPRRLVALAEVGNTSVDWILTGRHMESGSEEQERLDPQWLALAARLRSLGGERRRAVEEALRLVETAARAAEAASEPGQAGGSAPSATSDLMSRAWSVLDALWTDLAQAASRRVGNDEPGDPET